MNAIDEYAGEIGHLYVQFRRTDVAKRQAEAAIADVTKRLEAAVARVAELEAMPAAPPTVLCPSCASAVVVPSGIEPLTALRTHLFGCQERPSSAPSAPAAPPRTPAPDAAVAASGSRCVHCGAETAWAHAGDGHPCCSECAGSTGSGASKCPRFSPAPSPAP